MECHGVMELASMLVVIYCILFTAPYTLINRVFSTWLYVYMFLGLKFWRRYHPHISTIYFQVHVLGFLLLVSRSSIIIVYGHLGIMLAVTEDKVAQTVGKSVSLGSSVGQSNGNSFARQPDWTCHPLFP